MYRLPQEPSTARVSIWRKLKRLGAIAIQDAVWVLPDAPWPRDHLTWVAAEVVELNGEAMLWEGRIAQGQEQGLVSQFVERVETEYRRILDELGQDGADIRALSRRYQLAQQRDYFHSGLAGRVRQALVEAGGARKR